MKESTIKKHKAVIDEYVINGHNGTKAYQKIYPKSSDGTAASNFEIILRNTDLQNYLKSKQKKAQDYATVTHQELLAELKRWAYSDTTEFINLTPEDVKKMPIELRRLVQGFIITTTTTGTGKDAVTTQMVKLSFVNKKQASEMIAKHIGFFGEHNYQKAIPISDLTPQERRAKIKEYQEKIDKTLNKTQ
jgi:phage terminase small subunit